MRPGLLRVLTVVVLVAGVPAQARAGGGPLNVMVLYNADEPEAVAVAGYYQDARSLPDSRLCAISGIDSTQRDMDFVDFWSDIHQPLAACLDALAAPGEIDYLVVVRGLPYLVHLPDNGYSTSLSALLQVNEALVTGDGTYLAGQPQATGSPTQATIRNPAYLGGGCSSADLNVTNPYASWYKTACGIVRQTEHPHSFRRESAGTASGVEFAGQLFVVTRLDGFDYDDARALVDRAVAADGSHPVAEMLCMEGSDEARAARDPECEFTVRMLDLAGFTSAWETPFDGALAGHEVAAYFTGTANLRDAIADNTFVPGALADNLTSFGARPTNFFCSTDGTTCPASESQTSIARFVRAGATGVHGTVAEPLNNVFPNAGTMLLYTFGYNLGESYFFNQQFLYWQNLVLGDPLTTPYADRPVVTLQAQPGETLPQGSELEVTATHPDGVAALRLYVDDELCADATGSPLRWTVTGAVGSEHRLLAVAVAANVEVSRPGWPEETHLPQPDVQGWQAGSVVVGEPLVGPDGGGIPDAGSSADASGPAGDNPGGGCGCRTPGSGAPPLLALLFLLGLVARRWSRLRLPLAALVLGLGLCAEVACSPSSGTPSPDGTVSGSDGAIVDAGPGLDGAPAWDAALVDAAPEADAAPAVDPCAAIAGASYDSQVTAGAVSDRPAAQHADLNVKLRGWEITGGTLGLIQIAGPTDALAPKLDTLFQPDRVPTFSTNYQVYDWD